MGGTAVWKLLAEWGIENPTEEDVWEAIAELDEYKQDYYADGDLTEWLQFNPRLRAGDPAKAAILFTVDQKISGSFP